MPDTVTDHEPGPQLDAEVARKVMGWTAVGVPSIGQTWWYGPRKDGATPALPAYSTDLKAAWEVVEWLMARNPQRDFHLEHLDGSGWKVLSCYDRESGGWEDGDVEPASTPAEAICRAALKAASRPAPADG